jgi:copper chaperone
VSLDTQTATVVADPELPYETVLRTIKKTGKKVNTGEADGETRSVELAD